MGDFLNKLKEKLSSGRIDQTKAAVGIMIAALVLVAAAVLGMALSGIDIRSAKASGEEGSKKQEEAAEEVKQDAGEAEADAAKAENEAGEQGLESGEEAKEEKPDTEDTDPEEAGVPEITVTPNEPQPGLVHAISAGEMEVIRKTYDGTIRGYGFSLDEGSRDQYNRQLQAVQVNSTLNTLNANVLVFASDPNTPVTALAFQAGYEAGYTEKILDILKEQGVRATFFVTMEYVKNNPQIIKRMLDEGHEIGSHTASAPEEGIANLSLEDQMNDALSLQTYMEEQYGYTMSKYNFNSGVYTVQQAILMTRMGYQFVFCSLNYADYDPNIEFDSAQVLSKLEDMMHNGCIYCFHMTNKVTAEILPGLLQCMKDEGYSIISLR